LYLQHAAAAYLALLRRDTTSAVQHFSIVNDSQCESCTRDKLVFAELTAATGKPVDAMAILSRRPPGLLNPAEIARFAVLARILEGSGKKNDARDAYRAVVDAWRNGDSTARLSAAKARAAASRLGF